jgi:hypothetical protein
VGNHWRRLGSERDCNRTGNPIINRTGLGDIMISSFPTCLPPDISDRPGVWRWPVSMRLTYRHRRRRRNWPGRGCHLACTDYIAAACHGDMRRLATDAQRRSSRRSPDGVYDVSKSLPEYSAVGSLSPQMRFALRQATIEIEVIANRFGPRLNWQCRAMWFSPLRRYRPTTIAVGRAGASRAVACRRSPSRESHGPARPSSLPIDCLSIPGPVTPT